MSNLIIYNELLNMIEDSINEDVLMRMNEDGKFYFEVQRSKEDTHILCGKIDNGWVRIWVRPKDNSPKTSQLFYDNLSNEKCCEIMDKVFLIANSASHELATLKQ